MRDKSTATFPVHGHSNRPLPRNMRWFDILLKLLCIAVFMAGASTSSCLEYSGVVTFNGLPLPGARVIATQSSTWYIAITDSVGVFRFAESIARRMDDRGADAMFCDSQKASGDLHRTQAVHSQ